MKNNQLNNTFKNLSLQISSKNYVMIPKDDTVLEAKWVRTEYNFDY